MKKKIKVLSSVKLNLKDKDLKKLNEKVNLQFSINSKKETLKQIKDSDVYIASAAVNLDKNELYLGRWNYKNTEKYMDWANYDNCFKTSLIIPKKEK